MASPMNDIGEIVKKAKVLLLDIEGTTTSISFVTDELFPYALKHVKKFLEDEWETDAVKEAVAGLRKLAAEDQEAGLEGAVKIPAEDAPKEEQVAALVADVTWLMSRDRKVAPLKQLQGLVWRQGYDSGDVKGHVYDDVPPALQQWRSTDGRKVYIYSSGSVQAQKLLFGQSLAGDMLPLIDGHFDTTVGTKQEEGSYKKIVEQIGCKAEEVLFLTDILKEATAAAAAGLHTALLSRPGNAPLPDDVTHAVLHSLEQLAPTKKRKPDSQDEVPAKIAKTDAQETVTTTSPEETNAKTAEPETEKMDVEADTNNKTDEPKEEEKEPVVVETVVEEITDSSEALEAAVITKEPIVTEDKADEKTEETEKMDTAEPVAQENGEGKDPAPVAEETPPAVVTEIEEVTDKQALEEVAEIIEELVPIVEEPKSVEPDMADLQNVGEVLEKECDEILSKVQDVTNLDSIAVKPMLNAIAEETMETDNTDSNDIVDRILDTEQELEMKSSEAAAKEPVVEDEATEPKNGVADEVISTKPEEASSTDDNEKEVATNGTEQVEPSPAVETSSKAEETNDKTEEPEKETTEAKPADTPADESKPESKDQSKPESKVESKPESKDESKPESKDESKPESKDESTPESKDESKPESKVEETVEEMKPEDAKPENKVEETTKEEPQTNGTTNGIGKEDTNGDSKDEELSSRLAAEDGKEAVNGANGNGKTNGDAEVGAGDAGTDVEIKVKTVPAAEEHQDTIETQA